jgi:3-phenylpropionate/cinnamic acid dioxygenase small subunit
MTDEEQIRQVLARYWQYLDDRREAEWLALFANTARLEFDGTAASTREALEAIAADLKNHNGGKHISSNELVHVSADQATASSDVVFFEPDGRGAVTIRFYGRCDDTLGRVGTTWRFTSRRITFQGGHHG